jgi:hypothetical protein
LNDIACLNTNLFSTCFNDCVHSFTGMPERELKVNTGIKINFPSGFLYLQGVIFGE